MSDPTIIPARDPPPGQTSDFDNAPSIGFHQTISNAFCVFFVALFVALRLYTRIRLVKCVSWDDYLILIAACLYFIDVGLFQHMVSVGMGKHLWNVSASDFSPRFLETWTFAAVLYSIIMLFIKMSILMLYRRLFPINNFKYLWWLCCFCTFGYGMGAIFSSLFACVPVRANWDLAITASHCIDKKAFYIGNGVMNIITDLMILALPIPIVWKLSLELRQKVILSIVFTLGSISCIISLVRLLSIITWIRVGDNDITYTLQNIVIWSGIELAICIVCANAPCLRPFFTQHLHFLTSLLSSTTPTLSQKTPTTIGRKRSRDISFVFNGADAMELGTYNKSHSNNNNVKTMVSVTTGGDGDEEEGFVERKKSLKRVGEEDSGEGGIMVHSSFRIQMVRESV